jgi:hypothetical protein
MMRAKIDPEEIDKEMAEAESDENPNEERSWMKIMG